MEYSAFVCVRLKGSLTFSLEQGETYRGIGEVALNHEEERLDLVGLSIREAVQPSTGVPKREYLHVSRISHGGRNPKIARPLKAGHPV